MGPIHYCLYNKYFNELSNCLLFLEPLRFFKKITAVWDHIVSKKCSLWVFTAGQAYTEFHDGIRSLHRIYNEENGHGYYVFMIIILVNVINSACSLNYGKILWYEWEIWRLQRE